LPFKQQVASYKEDIESVWRELENAMEYGQNTYAHLVPLRHQYKDLWHQLGTRNKPKCTAAEAAATSKLQKHGFLTNPESKAAFCKHMVEDTAKHMVEDTAKQEAEAEKAARKVAQMKEIEGKWSLMIADKL
jgi:hypothetical protein